MLLKYFDNFLSKLIWAGWVSYVNTKFKRAQYIAKRIDMNIYCGTLKINTWSKRYGRCIDVESALCANKIWKHLDFNF